MVQKMTQTTRMQITMINDTGTCQSDQEHLLSNNNNANGNTNADSTSSNIKYGSLNNNDTAGTTSRTSAVSTSVSNSVTNSNINSASMIQVIASMTKNLVGCGALSLSYGIAYCTNNKLIGSLLIGPICIVTLGTIFGYYCWLIGKICTITNHYTYRSAWYYSITSDTDTETDTDTDTDTSLNSNNTRKCCTTKSSSVAVSIATSLKAILALLSYNTIVTDATLSLLPIISHYYYYIFHNVQIHSHQQSTTNNSHSNSNNDEELYISRTHCLLLITLFCLLPLCLLRNIKVLTPFSIVGTGGIVVTCIVMIVRWYDNTYESPNGYYYITLPTNYQPKFDSLIYNKSLSPAILPYICMVYEAFVMHYNSPRFYRELENYNLQRYSTVVTISFGSSCIMYTIIAVFGFLTFGSNCNSMILNNYSIYDPLISICRVAVIISTITAYPIVFLGLQDGIYDIFNISLSSQQQVQYKHLSTIITCILLSIITLISIYVYDLGLINAVGGGLVATAIVFVFPTIMLQSILYKQYKTTKQQNNINEDCTLLVNNTINDNNDNDDYYSPTNNNNSNNNIKSDVDMYVHTSSIESYTTIVLAIIGVVLGIVGAYIAVFKYK